ncbi:unnamed protein product [Caenorhabditis angaria]|uniref:Uncharacterized protein n=1 Tax=Caenorhabditis angaria TaxID=860376 RepID=A0A9P1IFE8_9PELO|nr:unnamed protein product [Caenorhabditis angaria]
MVVVERIFATYFVSDYEKNHRTWINFIMLPLTFSISQIYSFSLSFFEPILLIPMIFCFLMTMFSFITLQFLYLENSRKLGRLKKNPILYTLSKKYQIEENLKVVWYLRAMSYFMLTNCCFLTIFFVGPSIFGFQEISIRSALRYLDLAVVVICLFMPIAMFSALYYLKHPAFLRRVHFESRVTSRVSLKPINETSVYFSQLNISWN